MLSFQQNIIPSLLLLIELCIVLGKVTRLKKRSYVFIVGLLIGCTALIVCDCLLQDCLQDI